MFVILFLLLYRALSILRVTLRYGLIFVSHDIIVPTVMAISS